MTEPSNETKPKRGRPRGTYNSTLQLTKEGSIAIRNAMHFFSESQVSISQKIGKRQTTVSAWLVGRQLFSKETALELYNALQQYPGVAFLQEYALGKPVSERFLIYKGKMHHLERVSHLPSGESTLAQEKYILAPFYERIDELYQREDNKGKREIIMGLEGIISSFENKQRLNEKQCKGIEEK